MTFTDDARWRLDLDDGLIVTATERPDSPVLDQFFAGYDRAFVLPDEREELDGFRTCLAINPESRHRFGRHHRELVLVAADTNGVMLGGANFLATRIDAPPAGHPAVAVALNYVFVEAAARGRGLSRRLLDAVARLANRSVDLPDDAGWPAMFIEQNDPLRMTDQDYAADTSHAGIDQIDRLALWARLGAKLVDFPYVQPALSLEQDPDDRLAYAVIRFPLDQIEPGFFRAHLESFFGISVLKGGDPLEDVSARAQLDMLTDMIARGETIATLPMEEGLTRLRDLPARPKGLSFREFTLAR
jgi:GNAT superfamily N-acetyltransferase